MVKDVTNRGSIGKFYKQMFPPNHNKSKENTPENNDENQIGPKITKRTDEDDADDVENFFNQVDNPDLVPAFETQTFQYTNKKKTLVKPGSCPRYRRRSRQDRIKNKNKKQTLKDLGPGTTIIVIQKNEEANGSYSTRKIEDFNGLEQEIKKIRDDNNGTNKQLYKSENRMRKRVNQSQSFVDSKQQKGKPPLKSPTSQGTNNGSKIPMIKERRTSVKNKLASTTHRLSAKNPSQKSSRVNSIDSEPKVLSKTHKFKSSGLSTKHQATVPTVICRIDELIQQKKDALGIKPLDSALSNYKAVLEENKKLKKTCDEQKLRIKKLRQERVEQFKELSKHKEDKKKLEHIIKHDTPVKPRQNRSNYRADSRDSSNVSVGNKTATKSPKNRYESEYQKQSKNMLLEDEEGNRELKKSDTVKRLEPNRDNQVQQPKIGGKNHSEVITAELLRKSTQELMQSSFSNLKGIEKLYKMEKHDEHFETHFSRSIDNKHKPNFEINSRGSPMKGTREIKKMALHMSRNNEAYKFSPHKDQESKVKQEDKTNVKHKMAFEINADKLNSKAKEVLNTSPVKYKLEKSLGKPMKLK